MQIKTVGLRLLAIAVYQLESCQLTHRYREQAKAYRGTAFQSKKLVLVGAGVGTATLLLN
jgi:hypothetical protein